jgi:DNA-directed RNA polymerase subunit RPC12/RpoP
METEEPIDSHTTDVRCPECGGDLFEEVHNQPLADSLHHVTVQLLQCVDCKKEGKQSLRRSKYISKRVVS